MEALLKIKVSFIFLLHRNDILFSLTFHYDKVKKFGILLIGDVSKKEISFDP